MFTIADVIKLLTRIFVKKNKRFPKGLEGVDIRLKAKKIHDVGKANDYKGGISENQLKHFLAWEKQAITRKFGRTTNERFDALAKHLEKRDSLLGWLIISKESYQYSIFKIRVHNRGRNLRTGNILQIQKSWREIGSEDLQNEIETFLKKWENN